jgi:hypothetical protein
VQWCILHVPLLYRSYPAWLDERMWFRSFCKYLTVSRPQLTRQLDDSFVTSVFLRCPDDDAGGQWDSQPSGFDAAPAPGTDNAEWTPAPTPGAGFAAPAPQSEGFGNQYQAPAAPVIFIIVSSRSYFVFVLRKLLRTKFYSLTRPNNMRASVAELNSQTNLRGRTIVLIDTI